MFKPFGSLCAVIALAALTSAAQAQESGHWVYSWGGSLVGGVSAAGNDGGSGGLFAGATLTKDGTLEAFNSYCNDLNENIGGGAVVDPTTVYRMSNLTAAQISSAILGSYDGPGSATPGALVNAGYTVDGVGGQAKVNAYQFMVAKYWGTGLASAKGATALQLAIWHLWGFDNLNAYGSNALAQSMVANALAKGQNYSNPGVLWVYNSPTQNQIMYDGVLTPEADSLALLLPGLIPVGFAIRRRLRKA